MHILITEFMDDAAVASLAARFPTRYEKDLVDRPDALRAAVAGADALIVRNRTLVRDELLAAASRLKVVGRLGVGLDNIDVAACRARGIDVIPATGANALAVTEYVIATAMMLVRGVYTSTAAVAAGAWPRAALLRGREVAGKTMGVVGFGDIGRRVARLAAALGMRTLAHDPQVPASAMQEHGVDATDLDGLLAQSDVITLHVPLLDSTRNLFDAQRVARMKRGAVIVNTSRGGVVDEGALANALRSGHLGGAAFDVFADEPLGAGSPLANCPNVILTPHIAGVTVESNERVSALIAERVAAALAAR